jgi:hypothetical protein
MPPPQKRLCVIVGKEIHGLHRNQHDGLIDVHSPRSASGEDHTGISCKPHEKEDQPKQVLITTISPRTILDFKCQMLKEQQNLLKQSTNVKSVPPW